MRPCRDEQVPARGVLEHEVPVRLESITGSGCVLVAWRPMPAGTSGVLKITLGGKQLADEVQVVRCQTLAGAGDRYHLEASFLWVTAPGDGSLRHMASQLGLDGLTGADAELTFSWA